MLKIYISGSDVTSFVEYESIQITQQLNNRRNTARFQIVNTPVDEAQIVKIFKGTTISAVFAGASSVVVADSFQVA